jgi:hypothetical protein
MTEPVTSSPAARSPNEPEPSSEHTNVRSLEDYPGGNKLARYVLRRIAVNKWISQTDVFKNYTESITRQYVSAVFDTLVQDGYIQFVGTLNRRKYYVACDKPYTLVEIRNVVQAKTEKLANSSSAPKPTIWMGTKLSPLQFLNKLVTYKSSLGPNADEWDFERDIKPQFLVMMFGERGGHHENDMIAARAAINSYAEELTALAELCKSFINNPFLCSGQVTDALPDLAVNNYLSRHTNDRNIA